MAATKSFMNHASTKLIVILGSTAVGKTKLSIELAKRFDGEIISADSMQVYKGLDIITNKVTPEEKQAIPHHLIDVVSPLEDFTVLDFKAKALETIEDLIGRKKLPIVVGGTNYFIESLLWDFLIDDGKMDKKQELQNRKQFHHCGDKRKHTEAEDGTIEERSLHEQLMEIDPDRANQLHPNNSRKISRSLQIYHSTGHTHSSLMKEQQNQSGSSGISGPLRFPNSLVFWLTANQDVLDQRISSRVDDMVNKGLIPEIRSFYENYVKEEDKVTVTDSVNTETTTDIENNSETEKDTECYTENTDKTELTTVKDTAEEKTLDNRLIKSYEEGLFQAIGFKEFHSYLTYAGTEDKERDKLLQLSLNKLKQITTKYSKKQVRWVQNRFLRRPAGNSLPVYKLDASDIDKWDADVLANAVDIATSFVNGVKIHRVPYRIETEEDEELDVVVDKHGRHVCDVCNDRIIIGDDAWNVHLKSKRHRKMKASKKLREG